ncbi:Uncharacterised protein [Mycobacterium tuberculosis]|nr:Uncharacterised protein [Mycobacterium tuberculosis]
MEPFPARTMWRRAARQHKYTDFRLTSCTRCHAASSVFSIRLSSGGEMPALLNAISMRP